MKPITIGLGLVGAAVVAYLIFSPANAPPPVTPTPPNPPPPPPGAKGSPDIRDAQSKLKAAGFDPGPIDGVWGPTTFSAVQAFQQARGLSPSGQLDGPTRTALNGGKLSGLGGSSGTGSATRGDGGGQVGDAKREIGPDDLPPV